jgi:hypothetical protein
MKLKTKKEIRDYKKALKLSFDVWQWLENNPGKDKHESPFWEKIKVMHGQCPLCNFNIEYLKRECVLDKNCNWTCPLWVKWINAMNIKESKKYANIIYLKIKKEHKKYIIDKK